MTKNLSGCITPPGSTLAETDFLNQLASRTGCGLLVHVNNIYVNALNAQLARSTAEPVAACIAWLDRIKPAAAGELHLAGHITTEDIVIDDHGSRVRAGMAHLLACPVMLGKCSGAD